MGKKIEVQDLNGEPRWHLDGKLLGNEHVVLLRGGIEIHGMFDVDGDGPPGEPGFEFRIEGLDETKRLVLKPETDELRRPTDAEKRGNGFEVKTRIN